MAELIEKTQKELAQARYNQRLAGTLAAQYGTMTVVYGTKDEVEAKKAAKRSAKAAKKEEKRQLRKAA